MRFVKTTAAAILLALAVLACSGSPGPGAASSSADRLVKFMQSGDTLLLQGVFTDSLLKLMSIEQMVATREEFLGQFGGLHDVEGPTFDSDTSAVVILNFERMSLQASLEFAPQGSIRFLSVQPEPMESANTDPGQSPTALTDVEHASVLQQAFDADSQFVRLVTILSPT